MSGYIKPKAIRLLRETGAKSSVQYREICRLVSLFGYVSTDEIKYHLGINEKTTHNRLWYLTRGSGLLKRFPSDTVPENFYCLTGSGRELVEQFGVSDYISNFVPSRYNLMWQKHHRLLIKVYSALKHTWGGGLTGFIGDEHLRKERFGKASRVFDAEFFLRVYFRPYAIDEITKNEYEFGMIEEQICRCAIELETSLKAPKRYEKQANDFYEYCWSTKHAGSPIFLFLFVYETETIKDRLKQHLQWRSSVKETNICFVNRSELLERKGEAEVEVLHLQKPKQVKDLIELKYYKQQSAGSR